MFAEWYYATNGQRHGPVPDWRLKELAADGTLSPTDLVWQEGTDDWVPAKTVPGLFPSSTSLQSVPPGDSLFPTVSSGDREVHEYHEPSRTGADDYPSRSRRRRRQEANNGVPFVLMLGGVVAVSVIVGIIFAVASNGSVAVSAKGSSKTTTTKSSVSTADRGSYTVRLVADPKQTKHEGFHTKVVRLKSGDTINIKVRSSLHSDVDLYLVGPYQNKVASDISLSEHCSVSKTVRSGGNYTIIVTNLGPGNNVCRVSYTIQRKS